MDKKDKKLTDLERYQRDRTSVMAMLKFILTVVIVIAFCYAGKIVAVILVPFLIGFLLSKTSMLIAKPLSKLFDKDASKIKPGRKKSTHTKVALVVYVILNIFVVIFIILVCIGLVYQANNMLVAIADAAKTFKPAELINVQLLERYSVENGGFLTTDMIDSLKENVANMGQTVVNSIPQVVSSALSSVWKMVGNLPYAVFFVISIILSGFYFINDGPAVMKFFVKNTPSRKFRNRVMTLLNELALLVFRVLGGYFALFIITAAESFIVFFAAGLRAYAIVLAIVTALIDFLPVLGISVTMLPMFIYLIAQGDYVAAAIIAIGYIIMTIIRRFIEPPILGKSMHLHPLITLLSMAAGVYIWGAPGFLLGPVLAIIIIQALKVFEIDQKAGTYFSGVLDNLISDKDEKGKKAKHADSEEDSNDDSGEDAKESSKKGAEAES
ncbi:MAG: AI-2E family transporter [Ruminococcaceae bacterium]|nr:AI-2E family transporter [Oscillospiraceae bacterium]